MERRRRIEVTAVALCAMVVALCPAALGKYGGGSGTAGNPYLIYTAEHLKEVGTRRSDWHWEVHYKVMADIDLAGFTKPIGPMGTLDFPFMGEFDGSGKTISNLKIASASGDNVGLFGYSQANVRDLRLVSVDIRAPQSNCVGALVGRQAGGEIQRCHVDSGTVSGRDEVGGLIGSNWGAVSQCSTACSVSGTNKVGGLLGSNPGAFLVSACCSMAAVTGSMDVGGLVGYHRRVVKDCYATGEVHGGLQTGGLVGNCAGDGEIWNCYAAGQVKTNPGSAGGLCGSGGRCYSSFWDREVRGQASSSDGNARTTAQMWTGATFLGWGRSAAWAIDEGADYPRLAWEKKRGTPLTTPAFPGNEGDGTAQHPHLVHTPQELNAIGDFPGEWDRCYRLESDLDLAALAEPFRIIGTEQIYFTGTFDGNRHSIANFVCPYAAYGAGLIGYTRNATIKRTLLIDPRHESDWAISVGTLVGQQVEGAVEDCGVEGGSVASSYSVGGLIGRCVGGTVTRCYSTCAVTGRNSAEDIGGLIGKGERCNVNNAWAAGAVSGQRNVGGLIGRAEAGSITHCYSAGAVTGSKSVGGLLGLITDKTFVAGCFWDMQTSGSSTSAAGRGVATAELQKARTFIEAGWDLVGERANGTADTWCIAEGKGYPLLRWQPTAPCELPAPEEPKIPPEPNTPQEPKPPQEPNVPAEPNVPQEPRWADDFSDGESMPLWQVYQPDPSAVSIHEINGRLELRATGIKDSFSAGYTSSGWGLDGTEDFALKVDFHFTGKCTASEGWVSIRLVPSVPESVVQYVELRASCFEGEPSYLCKLADGVTWADWPAIRGADNGTLYLSYDATVNELYVSYVGYGKANAWQTVPKLLKNRWSGGPISVILGGGSGGMAVTGDDAWLDNFALDTGVPLP